MSDIPQAKISRRVFATDIILVAVIIVCLFFALYSYSNYSYTSYTESVTTITGYNQNMTEPYLDFSINFTGTVFSAQNPIQVSVIAIFDPSFQQHNASFIQSLGDRPLYFYLEGAVFLPRHYTSFGAETTHPITLYHQADGSYRNPTSPQTTVEYEYEGYKCFLANFVTMPSVPALCGDNEQPLIYISSADSLFQLRTQHYTATLTWFFGAFAVIIVRDDVTHMISSFIAAYKQRNSRDNANRKQNEARHEKPD